MNYRTERASEAGTREDPVPGVRSTSGAGIFAILLALTACDGGEETDAGMIEIDAGGNDEDAGGNDVDAGGNDEDAGMAMTDGGMDGGMAMSDGGMDGGMDAGPIIETPDTAGDVVITEIMADALGYVIAPSCDSGTVDWIELHNPSTTITYNLNGCTLADRASRINPDDLTDGMHQISTDLLIPPGGYIVVAASMLTTAEHGFDADYSYNDEFGMSGGGEDPTLKCGAAPGVVIDTVDYGQDGFPIPEDMAGRAIQVVPSAQTAADNDTAANWCFSTTTLHMSPGRDLVACPTGDDEPATEHFGTPGAVNTACPAP
jgi:hypothetical protein